LFKWPSREPDGNIQPSSGLPAASHLALKAECTQWNHRKHSPGGLRLALCDLYEAASADSPTEEQTLRQGAFLCRERALQHPATVADKTRRIAPFNTSQNAVPLPFTLRQCDLDRALQLAPFKARFSARRRLRRPQLIRDADRSAYLADKWCACWSLILSKGNDAQSHLRTMFAPSV